MKRLLGFMLTLALTAVLLSGCSKDTNRKIPFLPIDSDSVFYIGLYGYSQESIQSNNKEATEEETVQIINWLNSIDEYESKVKAPQNKGGKPYPSNIQVFTKDSLTNENTNFLYILEKEDGCILLGQPEAEISYIVKHPGLNEILKTLRK